jgi:hypothetical protein
MSVEIDALASPFAYAHLPDGHLYRYIMDNARLGTLSDVPEEDTMRYDDTMDSMRSPYGMNPAFPNSSTSTFHGGPSLADPGANMSGRSPNWVQPGAPPIFTTEPRSPGILQGPRPPGSRTSSNRLLPTPGATGSTTSLHSTYEQQGNGIHTPPPGSLPHQSHPSHHSQPSYGSIPFSGPERVPSVASHRGLIEQSSILSLRQKRSDGTLGGGGSEADPLELRERERDKDKERRKGSGSGHEKDRRATRSRHNLVPGASGSPAPDAHSRHDGERGDRENKDRDRDRDRDAKGEKRKFRHYPHLPHDNHVEPVPATGMYWSLAPVHGLLPNRGWRAHTVNLVDTVAWIFGGCDDRGGWQDLWLFDTGTL